MLLLSAADTGDWQWQQNAWLLWDRINSGAEPAKAKNLCLTSMETTFNPSATRGVIASLLSFCFVMKVLHVLFSNLPA